ncbi:hypothetical protein [Psychrobacter coccoides]|uniref:hypothetical protein n=1 Tax=Psychrobacter coccoides TaxID=2818440 RepID=UPI00311C989C
MTKHSYKSWLSLVGLSITLGLVGCSEIASVTQPVTSVSQPPHSNTQLPDGAFIQCPPFNPNQTICTAQYDPVCVKTESAGIINYRTAGNACSACSTPDAIGYVAGECS